MPDLPATLLAALDPSPADRARIRIGDRIGRPLTGNEPKDLMEAVALLAAQLEKEARHG